MTKSVNGWSSWKAYSWTLIYILFVGVSWLSVGDLKFPKNLSYCDPSASLEGVDCCKLGTVEQLNEVIKPKLDQLLNSDFFRYYKINLSRKCKFWSNDEMCYFPHCSIQTMEEEDVPECLRVKSLSDLVFPKQQIDLPVFKKYDFDEYDFCLVDGECSPGVFIDLKLNPERFTGYAGEPANKIWKAIYEENCFVNRSFNTPLSDNVWDKCMERRVFFRVISGLHASVSVHIAGDFFNSTTESWEKNFKIFDERVGRFPDRLQNMYLLYMLILRAIEKISSRLEQYNFGLGNDEAEWDTKNLVLSILEKPSNCPNNFDRLVFSSNTKPTVIEEFKSHFRNVSLIMDCVGCEKCRLWGKIQVTGIGTALKILFASESPARWQALNFRRSEIVALFNVFGRLSESVALVQYFRRFYYEEKKNVSTVQSMIFADWEWINIRNTILVIASASVFFSALIFVKVYKPNF